MGEMQVLIDSLIAFRRVGSFRLAARELGQSASPIQNMLSYHVLGLGVGCAASPLLTSCNTHHG